MITVADAEVAEVTQAANEVDYTTAKVIGLEIMITCKSDRKVNIEGLLRGPGDEWYVGRTKDDSNLRYAQLP